MNRCTIDVWLSKSSMVHKWVHIVTALKFDDVVSVLPNQVYREKIQKLSLSEKQKEIFVSRSYRYRLTSLGRKLFNNN